MENLTPYTIENGEIVINQMDLQKIIHRMARANHKAMIQKDGLQVNIQMEGLDYLTCASALFAADIVITKHSPNHRCLQRLRIEHQAYEDKVHKDLNGIDFRRIIPSPRASEILYAEAAFFLYTLELEIEHCITKEQLAALESAAMQRS